MQESPGHQGKGKLRVVVLHIIFWYVRVSNILRVDKDIYLTFFKCV